MTKSRQINIGSYRANQRECLVTTETADNFVLDLARYQQTEQAQAAELEATSRQSLECAYGYDDDSPEAERKPFVFKDGIAVIPVHGTLLNRFNSSWGFVTGYNFIRRQMNLAMADDDVEMIVLDVDSPGGEAAGNFELCREIMEARETKPILAVVDSVAASGGYSIIACCTRSYAIPSARIGSIGVYRMHIDISKMMEAEGVKITFAKAGDHKTDGNPYEPLSDSVKKEWEEAAGKTWDDFIAVVAEGRGLSPAEVRNTQARVYRADEALALGLIDAVKTTSEAVAAFVAELAEDEPFYEEDQMAEKSTLQSKPEVASGAPAAAPQVSADAIAAAITAHETQKRERRTAIRSLDGAKDHPALVQSLIEDTDLPVDAVKLLIQAADEDKPEPAPADESEDDEDEDGEQDGDDDTDESAAAGDMKKKKAKKGQKASSLDNQNHFASAMGNSDQPNVGAGREQRQQRADGDKSPADMASGILAAQAKITGREVKTTA